MSYYLKIIFYIFIFYKLWSSKRLHTHTKTHTHIYIYEIVINEQTAEQNKNKTSFKENGENTTFSEGAGLGVMESSASIHGRQALPEWTI